MVRGSVSALAIIAALSVYSTVHAQTDQGLLFRMSADKGFKAEVAGGDPVPNFLDHVKSLPGARLGDGYMQAADDGIAAWNAPGNIYAQRGTISFFWRSRYPAGRNPFNIFRVGYADHSSWDMVWLRIDWNGHGFDAFVTDDNLARVRVSTKIASIPAPDHWTHLAVAWDETKGIQLWIDGKLTAEKLQPAVLDSGLDEFGFANRVLSPHQVQSRYNYLRGSDFDELRVYDHMLGASEIAALAQTPSVSPSAPSATAAPAFQARSLADSTFREEWWWRYGWNRPGDAPTYLSSPETSIRKVEFADAKDIKEWMYKATDGIAETTWPGVYNRSRLPGRHDYFELPDWNVYVDGGKTLTLTLPNEPFNHLEIQGAAYGALSYQPTDAPESIRAKIYERPKDQERTFNQFPAERTGGVLRFTNIAQETPIQEIAAYNIRPGGAPEGTHRLSYKVKADALPDLPELQSLTRFIAGRYEPDERQTVMAVPPGAPSRTRKSTAPAGAALPLVHVLIPSNFSDSPPSIPLLRTYAYGWENMHDGLDGLEIKIPALNVKPTHGEYFPLNIQVKDPLWPERDLMDVSVSVKPGEARTVWLDTRDRILPNAPLYLTIAGAGDLDARQLDGMSIDLVFKDREAAKIEHVADRFNQVKDNWGFLVEEHTTSKRQRLYDRLFGDITDLLKVDPENVEGRNYWSEIMAGSQGWAAQKLPDSPAGEPTWAFRQIEDLKQVKKFVEWWIDNRQSEFGDFGGGISDDTDLLEQWPGLALMGVDPQKLTASHDRLVAADYKNGMFTNGLNTIHADELHSYEEGVNSNSENMYLNWGKPASIERLMTTADAYPRIIMRNPAGHVHFASDYFNGLDVVREDPWQWGKQYSYVILHPGLLMVDWNNQPSTKALLLDLADGYLAHGKQGPDGGWTYPAEINWPNDAERGGTGIGEAISLFYAAWRWTGDEKYLRPIFSEVDKRGLGALANVNGPMMELLNKRAEWTPKILKATEHHAGGKGDGFMQYMAWEATGDRRYLTDLFGDEVSLNSHRMYMVTEGHWWIDRVELPSDILQRTRLGGVALKRNYEQPGNTVAWRFDQPDGAEKLGILLPNPTPERFKVVVYNTDDKPVTGDLIGWDVAPGTWRIAKGEATGDSEKIEGAPAVTTQSFEKTETVKVSFAPRRTTILQLERVAASTDRPEDRPDVGIGPEDLKLTPQGVRVTVHGLGSRPTPAGVVRIEDAQGAVMAQAPFPALAAPLDLKPKTAVVTVPLGGERARAARVRLVLNGEPREITQVNNVVSLH
jgi:hypothetical protein